MTLARARRRSNAEWKAILDRIQETLARSLESIPELEPLIAPPASTACGEPIETLPRRWAELQACLERADGYAADIDALLLAEADHLRRRNERAKLVRERLANWAVRAV